jgi:hypothetical protein
MLSQGQKKAITEIRIPGTIKFWIPDFLGVGRMKRRRNRFDLNPSSYCYILLALAGIIKSFYNLLNSLKEN